MIPKNRLFHALPRAAVAGLISLALPWSTAQSQTVNAAAKYQQECAACHMAYPPGMLPQASWKRILGHLNKHFGTDASLDEASLRELSIWLPANADTFRKVHETPPQDRITQSRWFIRQHDEVPSATWKRVAIGSAANCLACHSGAAKGNFNEDDVRIPK
ncbi:MAG: diheme cytochrome c [Rhodoferax sp.]|uniref:diheme cytochrome c n=1 Tax=Rhodoferax sp. TaxID=50421 RepID=UPI0032646147